MIIKAKTRGNAVALGRYLLDGKKNEHIEIHSVHGFVSEDLMEAMHELDAMSQGVRSEQPLFSTVLSPPAHESVSMDVYEAAIAQIKERCGLADQPHIAVFHEVNARRHLHLVVSRIDHEHGRVIPLPFYKEKLFELSKEIYLEQDWSLPKGFIDRRERDPRNFDQALYNQAKRDGQDPKNLKMMAQEAWAVTKGKDQAAFMQELEKRGLYLAKGDRRSHVAMTWGGEVYALSRLLGCKTKDVRERLGHADDLRSTDDTRQYIKTTLEPVMGRLMGEADQIKARDMAGLNTKRQAMTDQHQLERKKMDAGLSARHDAENRERMERLRKGIGGLWDRLSGRYKQIKTQNDREAYEALRRDRTQRQAMIDAQLAERQALQRQIIEVRQRHAAKVLELHRDLDRLRNPPLEKAKEPQAKAKDALRPSQTPDAQSARQKWLRQQARDAAVPEQTKAQETSPSRAEWLRQQQRRTPEHNRPAPDRERGRNTDRSHDRER